MLEIRKESQRAKLIHYAERVWYIDVGTDEEKIDLAIQETREFFEGTGVKTRLSEYGVKADKIPVVIEHLRVHGMTALSNTQDLILEISQEILGRAM